MANHMQLSQPSLPGIPAPEPIELTPLGLLSIALQNNAAIDVIERLAVLQEKSIAKQAEQDFFRALQMAQQEVPRVEPNKDVKTSGGKLMYSYSTYEQLDRALRPIYIKYGMAISFNGAEAPAGKVRVLCCVSHRNGHAERYQLDLAVDQGAAQLTKTDAELAAQSKAKRRILRNIFNIVDDLEDEAAANGELIERVEFLKNCCSMAELTNLFKQYYKEFEASKPAKMMLIDAYEAQKKKLQQEGR